MYQSTDLDLNPSLEALSISVATAASQETLGQDHVNAELMQRLAKHATERSGNPDDLRTIFFQAFQQRFSELEKRIHAVNEQSGTLNTDETDAEMSVQPESTSQDDMMDALGAVPIQVLSRIATGFTADATTFAVYEKDGHLHRLKNIEGLVEITQTDAGTKKVAYVPLSKGKEYTIPWALSQISISMDEQGNVSSSAQSLPNIPMQSGLMYPESLEDPSFALIRSDEDGSVLGVEITYYHPN